MVDVLFYKFQMIYFRRTLVIGWKSKKFVFFGKSRKQTPKRNKKCVHHKIHPSIYIGFFPFHRAIMWPSLVKIQYTELKLLCGNNPVVRNSIYSNGDLDL